VSLAFDHVVLAAPAFESLKMVSNLSGADRLRAVLRRFTYSRSRVVVHSDPSVMPPNHAGWSAKE
jgi:predicted NAD/FAD-binding protein